MKLRGNCIIAQSGGPTAVINSSVAGVFNEALLHSEIEGIYASYNGILGILEEKIFDLRKEEKNLIEGLIYTPSAALGSCRYKIKNDEEVKKILKIFEKYNIRYFFYIGGNDSMDTANKIYELAKLKNYDIRVIGIPKTIDNDLFGTDHSPGYGSVIKYLATITMETAKDTESLHTFDTISVIEVMGRNAGWIAAGTSLAKRSEEDGPHIILFPEIPFQRERFKVKILETIKKYKYCVIVVSEGVKNPDGSYISEQKNELGKDSFGHIQLGGAGLFIKNLIESDLKIKTRFVIPSISQRVGIHFASKTDSDEAYEAGRKAVEKACDGLSGYMISFERVSNNPYKIKYNHIELKEVANNEKFFPKEWITEDGFFVKKEFTDYALPLIQGEVPIKIINGLPYFVRLKKEFIKKL